MARLLAGTGHEEITPDGPVPMSGYGGRTDRSSGVRDSLESKALVLSDGTTAIALVSVDLLNVSHVLTNSVQRSLAERNAGVDEFILAATHTHAGPYVPCPALDIHPTLGVEADVSATVEEIRDGIVESVVQAVTRLEPATLWVGRENNRSASINRRASYRDWGLRIRHGEIHSKVTVLDVETTSGEETVLFNFACHPVCLPAGNTLLSGDWPGAACRRISDATDGATIMFLNGATGDINPRDREDDEDSDAYLENVGSEIAASVLKARDVAREGSGTNTAPVNHASRNLSLPTKTVPEPTTIQDQLAAVKSQLDAAPDPDAPRLDQKRAQRSHLIELLALADGDTDRLKTSLRYVEVGSIGVLGCPGEVFAADGREFQTGATADTLLVAGYANGYVGYLPPVSELENGGYEVRTAKVAPEGLRQFRATGRELVDPPGTKRK